MTGDNYNHQSVTNETCSFLNIDSFISTKHTGNMRDINIEYLRYKPSY